MEGLTVTAKHEFYIHFEAIKDLRIFSAVVNITSKTDKNVFEVMIG